MDTVWDKYFDTSEKYEKLREIKRRVDPNYIFTANSFGVDATNAPENKNQVILGKDHDWYCKFSRSKNMPYFMLDNVFEINVPEKASEWVFIHFSI